MFQLKNVPKGGSVLAVSSLPALGDHHLRIVLVEHTGGFVTWLLNIQTWGYSHGHYFEPDHPAEQVSVNRARFEAFGDFAKRVASYTDWAVVFNQEEETTNANL